MVLEGMKETHENQKLNSRNDFRQKQKLSEMDYQLLEIHALLGKTVQFIENFHTKLKENHNNEFFCLKDSVVNLKICGLKEKLQPIILKFFYPENNTK